MAAGIEPQAAQPPPAQGGTGYAPEGGAATTLYADGRLEANEAGNV